MEMNPVQFAAWLLIAFILGCYASIMIGRILEDRRKRKRIVSGPKTPEVVKDQSDTKNRRLIKNRKLLENHHEVYCPTCGIVHDKRGNIYKFRHSMFADLCNTCYKDIRMQT